MKQNYYIYIIFTNRDNLTPTSESQNVTQLLVLGIITESLGRTAYAHLGESEHVEIIHFPAWIAPTLDQGPSCMTYNPACYIRSRIIKETNKVIQRTSEAMRGFHAELGKLPECTPDEIEHHKRSINLFESVTNVIFDTFSPWQSSKVLQSESAPNEFRNTAMNMKNTDLLLIDVMKSIQSKTDVEIANITDSIDTLINLQIRNILENSNELSDQSLTDDAILCLISATMQHAAAQERITELNDAILEAKASRVSDKLIPDNQLSEIITHANSLLPRNITVAGNLSEARENAKIGMKSCKYENHSSLILDLKFSNHYLQYFLHSHLSLRRYRSIACHLYYEFEVVHTTNMK